MRLWRVIAILVGLVALMATGATAKAAPAAGLNGGPVSFSISPTQPVATIGFRGKAGEQVSVDFEPDPGFTLVGNPTSPCKTARAT